MFSKKESNLCKGIAIILMLFHHLFYNPQNHTGYVIVSTPFSLERLRYFANLSKICVAIFVFISGYGIAASYRRQFSQRTPSARELSIFTGKRILKLLTMYWFAFALTFICQPLGQSIFDAYGTDLKSIAVYFLIDFLGLAHLFGTPTLNPTWWYMSLALMIIVLIPIVMRFIDNFGTYILIASIIGIQFFMNASNPNTFYLITMCLGIICFEKNTFHYINKAWNTTKWNTLIKTMVISIIILILLLLRTSYNYYGIVDALIAVGLSSLVSIIMIHIPIISSSMQYLGKYSGNIFLIHNQIYSYYFRDFIYSFKYWYLILLVLLIFSLLVSVIMEFCKKIFHYDIFISKLEKSLFKIS